MILYEHVFTWELSARGLVDEAAKYPNFAKNALDGWKSGLFETSTAAIDKFEQIIKNN